MIADSDQKVAALYGMIHPDSDPTVTVRAVYVIDPNKQVRLVLTYPPSTGRNFAEFIRAIDSLQLTDAQSSTTPMNWNQREEVTISQKLADEEDTSRFTKGFRPLKTYLR